MTQQSDITHNEQDPVIIFTDGACRTDLCIGGWGVLLTKGKHVKELRGGARDTTNNRMELLAACIALETLKQPLAVILHTDSQYVRNGITQWMPNWKRNGWRKADRKPVKNADLWERLDLAQSRHKVEWVWVKAHSGNVGNERADALAREGMARFLP
ncbi:ribonuclease HI [Terasakiella pusilla]|uniref:ribonuclease HI n=1 Tax=Terasakiella pusilla TaxID=64973 RepID=UPI003AA8F7CA